MIDVGTNATHNIQCSYSGDSNYASTTSNTVTETYTQLPMPQFSPLIGIYPQGLQVTISDGQGTIYYTVDGNTPTSTSATYGSPITLNDTTTLKAIASAPGYLTSLESHATYTIQKTGGIYSLQSAALSNSKGASGSNSMMVKSNDAYVGTVHLTCSIFSDPPGAVDLPTCSAGQDVTLTSNTTSSTTSVSIKTTPAASTSAAAAHTENNAWRVGSALTAVLILFFIPRHRRGRRAV